MDLARVLGLIALGLVVANFALFAAYGPAPAFLREAEVLNPMEFDQVGEQLAGAELDVDRQASSRVHSGDAFPLAIVAGFSTAREDISSKLLGSQLCRGMRVLNLGRSGGSFRELAYYLQALRRSSLRPSVLVLAIHPAWLAGRESVSPQFLGLGDLINSPPRDRIPVTKRIVAQLVWLRENRVRMNSLLTNALLAVRGRVADRFGLTAASQFTTGSGDPWRDRINYDSKRAPQELLDSQMRNWYEFGWFSGSRYSGRSAEAIALRALVTEASQLAGRTVAVLMPESSDLRKRIPEVARSITSAILAHARTSFSLVDLQGAIPDSLFYDYAHLNAEGRALFTRVLAAEVTRAVQCAPPRVTSPNP